MRKREEELRDELAEEKEVLKKTHKKELDDAYQKVSLCERVGFI
jgi:hypothetical protein